MTKPSRKRAPARAVPPPRTSPALPLRKKLLFSAVVVLGVLAILEGGARLLVHVVPNSRWEFHRQLVDSVGFPALNDALAPDPVLFWSLRPNLEQKALSGRIAASGDVRFTLSTDGGGHRRVPTVAGSRRLVAFLGDSCTFGFGVNDDQTFAALVQQRMPEVQAVNLGVPGYTAYQGRVQLTRVPFSAPPAAVVVTFGFNDEAVWDNRSDLEHAEDLESQRSWVHASRFMSALASLLRPPAAATAAPAGPRRPRLTDEEFTSQIRSIAQWCRARGAKPLLVLWPYRAQLTRTDMSPKQRALVRVAAAEKLPIVNLVPAFRAGGAEFLFLDIIHASAAGHEVVAGALQSPLGEILSMRSGAQR